MGTVSTEPRGRRTLNQHGHVTLAHHRHTDSSAPSCRRRLHCREKAASAVPGPQPQGWGRGTPAADTPLREEQTLPLEGDTEARRPRRASLPSTPHPGTGSSQQERGKGTSGSGGSTLTLEPAGLLACLHGSPTHPHNPTLDLEAVRMLGFRAAGPAEEGALWWAKYCLLFDLLHRQGRKGGREGGRGRFTHLFTRHIVGVEPVSQDSLGHRENSV